MGGVFFSMSRNQLTKDQIKCDILKLKRDLFNEHVQWSSNPKKLANKYIDLILEKIEEYRY